MFNIASFFKKIQNAHTRELFIRTVIQDAVRNQVKADLPIEAISFSGNAVMLKNVNSSLRSAIFIKKQAILADINKAQQIRVIGDIR